MASILDITLAMCLGGLLLLGITNSNQVLIENELLINNDMLVQQMLISTAALVEGEFRNMGMGVPEDSSTILQAEEHRIMFLSDLARDGTSDKIEYWVGPLGEIPNIQNDSLRLLHRRVNNGSTESIGMVSKFILRYFSQSEMDTLSMPVAAADLEMIKIVEITMEIQNPSAMYRDTRDILPGERNALFSSSYWRQTRLASQNLKR